MSEEKWKLSLDIKDFVKGANEAKESVLKVGDSENLSGLINSLGKTTSILGIVGIAALALKATIDAVFDAEQIKAVNAQFDVMAKNAGLAGDAIRDKVVEAAKGLADDTKIIQSSTKAIAELGNQAGKIPEIMDLARKTTNAFGGDLVENFDRFATAAATGNTRILRQMNLVIDSDVALKKYAKSLHVSVEELSDAGRKHAILNEILEKGNKNLKGVDENAKPATDAWTRVKVAVGGLTDSISLLVNKLVGPAVVGALETFGALVKIAANPFDDSAKHAREVVESNLKHIEEEIKRFEGMIAHRQKFNIDLGDIPKLQGYLDELNTKKDLLDKKLGKMKPEEKVGEAATPSDDVDKEKRAKSEEKFNKELLTLNKMRHEEEIKNAQFSSDIEAEVARDKEFRTSQILLEAKIKNDQISQEYANKDDERRQLLEQNDALTQARMLQVEEETKNRRIAIMKEATDHSITMGQGVTNAFKEGAAENRKNLTDWGATGRVVFGAFAKNSKSALLEFGAGTKTAGEAMRGFLFGAIADTAEAKGMELLLSSIWPPNPVGMGAGAGLVALAGALRSQAGGSSGGGVSGGGGGGGGGAAAGTGSTPVESGRPTEASTAPRSGVMITVQGHWLETDQSKSWLTDQIRSASDNQDFSFKRIGEA